MLPLCLFYTLIIVRLPLGTRYVTPTIDNCYN